MCAFKLAACCPTPFHARQLTALLKPCAHGFNTVAVAAPHSDSDAACICAAAAAVQAGLPEISAELREHQLLQYIISHQALWLPAPSSEPSAANITKFERFVIPSGQHPLEGLWKGTYGSHGLEIISLTLSADGRMLLAHKASLPPFQASSMVKLGCSYGIAMTRQWPRCM